MIWRFLRIGCATRRDSSRRRRRSEWERAGLASAIRARSRAAAAQGRRRGRPRGRRRPRRSASGSASRPVIAAVASGNSSLPRRRAGRAHAAWIDGGRRVASTAGEPRFRLSAEEARDGLLDLLAVELEHGNGGRGDREGARAMLVRGGAASARPRAAPSGRSRAAHVPRARPRPAPRGRAPPRCSRGACPARFGRVDGLEALGVARCAARRGPRPHLGGPLVGPDGRRGLRCRLGDLGPRRPGRQPVGDERDRGSAGRRVDRRRRDRRGSRRARPVRGVTSRF